MSTVLSLIGHSARLVLTEGSVPTAIFGAGCLGSLWTRHPLMYGFVMEFIGPDTAQGREMTSLWQYEGFRHSSGSSPPYGTSFPARSRPAGRHRLSHLDQHRPVPFKVMPYVWAGVFVAWTVAYGRYRKKKGERMMAAAGGPRTSDTDPQSADITKAADQA